MKKLTLYECFHARVRGDRIYCDAGLNLSPTSVDGTLDVRRLARGEPLAMSICQGCVYFERMGPPLSPDERGWLNGKVEHIK
jgi:hypothetical protein